MINTKSIKNKVIAILIIFAMTFTLIPADMVSAETYGELNTETPAVVITGDEIIKGGYTQSNISNEKSYTLSELKNIENESLYRYSSINSSATKKLHAANGIELTELMQLSGVEDVSGKPLTSIAEDGNKSIINDLSSPRYYYPNIADGNDVDSAEVPDILAWAQTSKNAPTIPETPADMNYLQILVGQSSVTDVNSSMHNKYVNQLQLGSKITETVLTVGDKAYTRAEVLKMSRATHTYSSTVARGIPVAFLFANASDNKLIKFTSVNGDTIEVKKSEVDSKNYMLAYEEGESVDNLQGIFGKPQDISQQNGFLTLYRNGAEPFTLVDTVDLVKSIDYSNSPYKHITNGGKGNQPPNNYNIDAITSATVTVEGPAVKRSVPLSVRELETNDDSLYRGEYEDSTGVATYEGVDLAYMLTEMAEGDNGIVLTDEAKKIQLKDINRKTVATLSIQDILDASEKGKPAILAYGIGKGDKAAPFVFTHAIPGQTNAGYISELGNDDGCMKLVYDLDALSADAGENYTKFTNAAYIYIMAESEPGYKHNVEPYNSPHIKNSTIAFDGKALGREINLTTEQIEALHETDMGHKDEYSLANNNYWYVNEYEGIKLWDLVKYLGVPDEDSQNEKKKTKVKFTATDGYVSTDSFTYEELSNPDLFGYYEKNADDLGDGKYVPKEEDLIKSGYPVMLASGVNRYPYVINSNDEGFMSGLSNDGGPMRVIFGKREYSHANGSSQIQWLNNVTVGEGDYKYNTHKYNDTTTEVGTAYSALSNNSLNITVKDEEGRQIKNTSFSVGDIEDLIYSSNLGHNDKTAAQSKAFYEMVKGESAYSDLYEGVNLEYLIWDALEIPGIKGNITFKDSEGEVLTVPLEDLLKSGYNTTSKQSGLKPILAFAKNGSPMVLDKNSDGYLSSYKVTDGIDMAIKNDGGPLAVLLPSSDADDKSKVQALKNVTAIEIDLQADQYAHVKEPYDSLKDSQITVKGEGTYIEDAKKFKVEEIESKQTLAVTGDYNIKTESEQNQLRYRGISLYDFLKSNTVGLRINADKVIITSSDGDKVELSLADIMKSNYINGQNAEINNLKPIIAYGSASIDNNDKEDGLPLVKNESAEGYALEYDNQGGPLKFVIGQRDSNDINSERVLSDIAEIEVTATELDSWKHSVSDIYSQYLDYELELVVKNSDNQWTKKYTLKELEEMDGIISRNEYSVISQATHEGVDLWKFVNKVAGGITGINDPVAVKCFASDGYSSDILSSFGMDQLKNGVIDGAGDRKPIIMAYATNGYPLVPDEKSDGYSGAAGGNAYGPLRIYTEMTSGTCLKNLKKVEVTIPGSGSIVPVDPSESEFKLIPSNGNEKGLPDGASVRCVSVNQKGDMWIGTYNAGAYYKPVDSDNVNINTTDDGDYKLESLAITAIAEDAEGGIWFSQSGSYTDPSANKGAAYIKDGETKYFNVSNSEIPHNYVQEIKIDSKGNVWFGSFGGLTKYDPKTGKWQTWAKKDGLPADSVNRIIIDENDGIWVGCYPDTEGASQDETYTGGYCYMDNNGNIKFSYSAQSHDNDGSEKLLADSWVRDMSLDDEGGIWTVRSGSYGNLENVGGRIDYIDANKKITHYTGKQLLGSKLNYNSEVRAIEVDKAGNIWLGTWTGVFVLDSNLNLIKEFSKANGDWDIANMDNIYSINLFGDSMYIGSVGGVAYNTSKLVVPVLENIKVSTKPKKVVYNEGEKFDRSGMVITANYSDGSQRVIKNYTVDKDILKYGDNRVKISYQGKTAELNITVNKSNNQTSQNVVPVISKKNTTIPKSFKPKAQKKKAKIVWKKAKGVSKYQIAYKLKGKKKWKYKTVSSKKKSITIKKLKSKKRYQFKIRSYKKINGKNVASKWSKTRTIKIK